MKLIFEKSVKGRDGYSLPQDVYLNMLLVKIKKYLVKYRKWML
jgi:hypothetical protein